ncbi:MAG: hypothetical protein ABSC29_00485 [Minisyncoccia bacterium]|jgi:hypothetical protein
MKVRSLLPRTLAILFALFLAIFSLDVFGEGYGFWGTVAAFIIHNIPSLLIIGATAVAWRHKKTGGVIFIALGIAATFFYHTAGAIASFAAISLPFFVIGVLFLVEQ